MNENDDLSPTSPRRKQFYAHEREPRIQSTAPASSQPGNDLPEEARMFGQSSGRRRRDQVSASHCS